MNIKIIRKNLKTYIFPTFFIILGKELIESLPKEVNLGMFELYCEDLIQNLWRKTGVLRESILRKMSQDHQVSPLHLDTHGIYRKMLNWDPILQ